MQRSAIYNWFGWEVEGGGVIKVRRSSAKPFTIGGFYIAPEEKNSYYFFFRGGAGGLTANN